MGFKISSTPTKNTNDYQATKTIPMVPGKRDPAVDGVRSDVVPEKSPPIPWPAAQPVDHKPFKLNK